MGADCSWYLVDVVDSSGPVHIVHKSTTSTDRSRTVRWMTTTRIYLVRHGATQLTAEDRFSGSSGVELSEEGRWQAARLGERLRARGRDARSTAAPSRGRWRRRGSSAAQCGRAERSDRRTARDQSRPLGRTDAARGRGALPGEYESWEEDPFTFAPEGGESGVAVLARALPVIRTIVTRHPTQRVRRRLAQGDDPHPDQQPPRLRRARLPRPPRPGAGLPQRPRLPRRRPRAADALQRHLALLGEAARGDAEPVEVVGQVMRSILAGALLILACGNALRPRRASATETSSFTSRAPGSRAPSNWPRRAATATWAFSSARMVSGSCTRPCNPSSRRLSTNGYAAARISHFIVKRLRDPLTPAAQARLRAVGERYRGKSYDLYFEWSDDTDLLLGAGLEDVQVRHSASRSAASRNCATSTSPTQSSAPKCASATAIAFLPESP